MASFFRRVSHLLLFFCLVHPGSLSYGQSLFPPAVKRVVFLGNSITYAGQYVTAIDSYYRLHYPNQPIEFINVGLPSETVSGLSEDGPVAGFPAPTCTSGWGGCWRKPNPTWFLPATA